ncbi:phage terminase small subunit P27 family [Streptomyces sp. G2]|uniref:phage terminase small subunit P27 family n=1 Tax=Streptomyces sp. G2 TaxID=1684471 RepID=UPI00202EC714|nr:phage terminase small subunit P27 family [Streptomyces sp. G2]MCM1945463.1 phage terminase small subunit P27 family [Streptomyces sp. G2]
MELAEPDWADTFPPVRGNPERTKVNARARAVASEEWRRVVPLLALNAGLGDVDTAAVKDYCVCLARIDECERELSRNGLLLLGERGWQKNGATTIVGQYRTQLSRYIRELGLSPSARTSLTAPEVDPDDDIFD